MYGIYANIGGILVGSMLPYMSYMDPMGYMMYICNYMYVCVYIIWDVWGSHLRESLGIMVLLTPVISSNIWSSESIAHFIEENVHNNT